MAYGGKKIPDHAAIAGVPSLHFAPCAERIPAEVCEFSYRMGELPGKATFIDGTKIEACVNKYMYVME